MMYMKNIQELLSLKYRLETEIKKYEDPSYSVVANHTQKVSNMKNTLHSLLFILNNYALVAWIMGENITEKQIFEWTNDIPR